MDGVEVMDGVEGMDGIEGIAGMDGIEAGISSFTLSSGDWGPQSQLQSHFQVTGWASVWPSAGATAPVGELSATGAGTAAPEPATTLFCTTGPSSPGLNTRIETFVFDWPGEAGAAAESFGGGAAAPPSTGADAGAGGCRGAGGAEGT
jgi:hypothetical protein